MLVDRSRLPVPGPDVSFAFPEVRRGRLENGVQAWTIERQEVPLISALVILPAGAASDPMDRPGLAAMTGDLLDEGCGDLDALALHEALGRIGGQLETEVGPDATLIALTSLARFGDRCLELLADLVVRPRLDGREFERVRDLRLSRLVQLRDMPPAIADRLFAALIYDGHPYGHLPIGTETSLQSMTTDDVVQFHRRVYDPRRATVIAVGAASHERLAEMLERAFGRWAPRAEEQETYPDPTAAPTPAPPSCRVVVHDRPGAAQSELRIGHVSVPRSSPDYFRLLVLNMVLGGQFVSRVNLKLREEKGYTYGVRTAFDFRRGPGPFALQTSVQSDATADAVHEALGELGSIRGDRPVTKEELELGRAALTRGYPRNFETADQVGRAAAQIALYELPDDYFTTFVPTVRGLRESDITAAAATHIQPDRLLVVIVGDREKIGSGLSQLGLGEPVPAA